MGSDDRPESHDEASVDELLEAAYAVDGPEANRALYADWADSYDRTFIERSGYVYHEQVAGLFAAGFTSGRGPVLDVGCGTGVVGIALHELGIVEIDGVDISREMLEAARTKTVASSPVYRDLIEADLTGPIDLPSHAYAGIVSAGTFTHGHLGPDSLDELIRVARRGARCAIGINAAHFDEFGFRSRFDSWQADATISDLQLVDAQMYDRTGDDADDADDLDRIARVAVFTVT